MRFQPVQKFNFQKTVYFSTNHSIKNRTFLKSTKIDVYSGQVLHMVKDLKS